MIFHLLQLSVELAQTRPQAVHLVLMVWSTAVAGQEREIGADTPNLPFNRPLVLTDQFRRSVIVTKSYTQRGCADENLVP